jgi:ribose transport system permease protein
MTLAAYLAMGVMHGNDGMLLAGVATGLGIGLGAGLFNVLLIQGLRIPPMIATLAAGFILQSMATAYSSGSTARPGPALMAFVSSRVLGVPTLAILAAVIAVIAALALEHTVFGRSVLAVGQSRRAAVLARLSVRWTEASVYVLSGLLAGAAGVLLATFSGGASLDMAGDYLLMSIAVVILGGTSIAGGEATVLGVWAASLFLYLMVTMLNVLQVGAGLRFVLSGLIIIGVLSLASRGERGR